MPSYTSLFLLSLATPLALAAPAPSSETQIDKRSFTVPRIANERHVRNGKKALAKAYRKYGWPYIVWGGSDSSESEDGQGFPFPFSSGSGSGSGFGGFGSGSGSGSGFGSGSSSSAAPAFSSAAPLSVSASVPSSAAAPSASAAASSANDASQPASSAAPAAAAASGSGVTGEAAATAQEGGAEYLVPVTIGGQKFNLDFDTGSADLWVYGPQAATNGQASFSTSKSSTFKAISGSSFKISYGDGSSASGTVGTDKVSVGAATVSNQAVEIATQVSSEFQSDSANDGLLGLAFSTINSVRPKQQKTFFASIQSQLEQPVFTVYLNESGQGEYEFGTIDSSKYSGDIHYTPVNTESGFWQFTSTSFKVGNTVGKNTNASPTIADTGTSLMLVDDALLTAYYGQVSGAKNSASQGGYVYPCSAKLPDFSIAIGSTGAYATIPGSSITYQKLGSTCFGGIQSNSGQGLQIFGDVFLRSQFTVFDAGKTQIGFAAKP